MKLRRILTGVGILTAVAAAGAAGLAWRPSIAPVAAATGFDPALVARGAQLAAIGDCAVCHAAPGGSPHAGGRPVRTPFGAVYASNITPDRDTGIGTWSEAAFARAMRRGVSRDGGFLYPAFPYNHYAGLSDEDVAAIYAFVMTREPVRAEAPPTRLPFPLNVRPLMASWNLLFLRTGPVPADAGRSAEWNRGAYLVEGLAHCGACHSPRNALGAEEKDRAFAGGEADGWDVPGLTQASSPAPVPWTADALFRYLRTGMDAAHGASAGPMRTVTHQLAAVNEADVRAMAVFVASMTDPGGRAAAAPRPPTPPRPPRDPPAEGPRAEGAVIFAGACATCHGAGAANGPPSLALASSLAMSGPRNAARVILGGLQPAPGEQGPYMPAFAAILDDAQVAAVLDYLRAGFTDHPAWPGLSDQVRRVREDHGS